MFGELLFPVAVSLSLLFSLSRFFSLSLSPCLSLYACPGRGALRNTIFQDKPKFAIAGRRPEVESARSSGGGQGGGRASPLPRRRREILRISVGIPDICEFRAIAFACECAGEKGPTQVGRQRICTYTYDAYICMYVPMLVRESVCACACVSYDCWLVIGLDSMRRSCSCEYVCVLRTVCVCVSELRARIPHAYSGACALMIADPICRKLTMELQGLLAMCR